MTTGPVEVFVAAYNDEASAAKAMKDFKAMNLEGSIDLIDGVVVVHDSEGKVRFEETADPSGKKMAKRGAIAGGLVGLIFPPAIIASGVVGGAAGGVWGKVRDKGFKDEELKEIGEKLPPGSSALVVIAQDKVIERLERGLAGYEKVSRHVLSADAAAVILAEAESTDD